MEMVLGLKLTKERRTSIIHFGILLIAGLSTILRPSMESKITLFRVILPFLFLWLFASNSRRAIKLSLILISFLVYSLLVSFISRFHTWNLVYNLYYITVIFFYFYYKEILRICGAVNIYSFLAGLYKVIIVLGLLQQFFGGVYFNTQDRLPAVNIFFWNENEFSAVLAIFTPLFFLKEKKIIKYLWMVLGLYLIVYNDAKLALLSLIVFFGGYFLIKFKLFKIRYFGFLMLGILGILTLFFAREYSIQGEYTIEFFLDRLTERLITQEPLEHIGTFNSRSNAVILGVKEFINSYLIGIGPGNSLIMMDEIVVPGTEKWSALSMHNFTLQLVTEMGIFGILMLTVFFLKVRMAGLRSTYPSNLVFIFFISCIISITLLSGAWSNYFYLLILFYAVDFFEKNV
jgi:hypothetical protein